MCGEIKETYHLHKGVVILSSTEQNTSDIFGTTGPFIPLIPLPTHIE